MNLETNQNQFPKGMKQLAQDIRALGFRPGIWMAPFGTGNEEFYRQHKDWFLHSPDGKPISSWNGKYTLDPTVPAAREHLRNIFKIAREDWGYEFFKIDGMSGRNKGYCAHMFERPEVRAAFKNPDCKNPFERCAAAFRRAIGDDRFFLACQGHLTGPEAAYADASRSGADIVSPNKPVMWKNILMNALGINDPIEIDIFDCSMDIDEVLLCSDGLTTMVTLEQIEKVLNGEGTVEEKVIKLIKKANNRGGNDNISIAYLVKDEGSDLA